MFNQTGVSHSFSSEQDYWAFEDLAASAALYYLSQGLVSSLSHMSSLAVSVLSGVGSLLNAADSWFSRFVSLPIVDAQLILDAQPILVDCMKDCKQEVDYYALCLNSCIDHVEYSKAHTDRERYLAQHNKSRQEVENKLDACKKAAQYSYMCKIEPNLDVEPSVHFIPPKYEDGGGHWVSCRGYIYAAIFEQGIFKNTYYGEVSRNYFRGLFWDDHVKCVDKELLKHHGL